MIHQQEIQSVLKEMPNVGISNLTIFYDNDDFFNELPPSTIDTILFGYHNAYVKFRSKACLDPRDEFSLAEFPDGVTVLTRDRQIFKNLYHSPERFDLLPDWVRGYVNFVNSIYVQLFEDNPRIDDELATTHEFVHTVIPNILGISAAALSKLWPTWINEAFTVSLSQRRSDSWITEQARRYPERLPTIESISKKGIFAHDQRKPEENLAYQYCALIGESLGKEINGRLPASNRLQGPLGGICTVTENAHNKGTTIYDQIKSLDIDMTAIELVARQRIGVTNNAIPL